MLSIKAVRLDDLSRDQNLHFKAFYSNESGETFSFHIILYPPNYFAAITPNTQELINVPQLPFSTVKLKSLNQGSVIAMVELKTNLHTKIATQKIPPDIKHIYNGEPYLVQIDEETEERPMGPDRFYRAYIEVDGQETTLAEVSEYPEGSFTFTYLRPGVKKEQIQALIESRF